MAAKREIETKRFQAQDKSGNLYTIIYISEQTDIGGLNGRQWTETMARLITTEGHSVNMLSADDYHIVNRGIDVKRVA